MYSTIIPRHDCDPVRAVFTLNDEFFFLYFSFAKISTRGKNFFVFQTFLSVVDVVSFFKLRFLSMFPHIPVCDVPLLNYHHSRLSLSLSVIFYVFTNTSPRLNYIHVLYIPKKLLSQLLRCIEPMLTQRCKWD